MRIMPMVMFVGLVAGTAAADTVVLTDGTVRTGTVVGKNEDELLLRIDQGGIRATLSVPANRVAKVVKDEPAATAAAPIATVDAATMPATPAIPSMPAATSPARATELPPTRGFLMELGASALGQGPDDPRRLPVDLKELWDDAVRRDTLGMREATLESLRTLDDAFLAVPGGMDRLDAICKRERKESFGQWLARVHWDFLEPKYLAGRFDWADVREAERKPLIGMLKEKTGPALEPLKTYFPPIDEKTGKPKAFQASQLAGITAGNALEVKQKALYASAILLGQLKLEPDMPIVDRVLLSNQLQNVRRILNRANELEPAAKAAAERAARDAAAKKK